MARTKDFYGLKLNNSIKLQETTKSSFISGDDQASPLDAGGSQDYMHEGGSQRSSMYEGGSNDQKNTSPVKSVKFEKETKSSQSKSGFLDTLK